MDFTKVGKALQTAANNAAATLVMCKEAGVEPVARKKPGRKAAVPKGKRLAKGEDE